MIDPARLVSICATVAQAMREVTGPAWRDVASSTVRSLPTYSAQCRSIGTDKPNNRSFDDTSMEFGRNIYCMVDFKK